MIIGEIKGSKESKSINLKVQNEMYAYDIDSGGVEKLNTITNRYGLMVVEDETSISMGKIIDNHHNSFNWGGQVNKHGLYFITSEGELVGFRLVLDQNLVDLIVGEESNFLGDATDQKSGVPQVKVKQGIRSFVKIADNKIIAVTVSNKASTVSIRTNAETDYEIGTLLALTSKRKENSIAEV